MKRQWIRLIRILHQSRIRVPARPFNPDRLQPGDWIQIGSRVWRVQSQRVEGNRSVRIALETTDGRASAALLSASQLRERWTFEQGAHRVELPEGVLLVFPAGTCGRD